LRMAPAAGDQEGGQEAPRRPPPADRAGRAGQARRLRGPAGGTAGAGVRGGIGPMTAVLVLNGPNLGRLGSREPEVYGTSSLADIADACRAAGKKLGLEIDFRQTDDEAE